MSDKIVANYAFPMKICYLKDEDKPETQENRENPSLAYLSSIIQSDKKRSTSQKFAFKNTKPNSFSITPAGKPSSIRRQIKKPPLTSYQGWRNEEKSKSEEKPMLTNIVGENWQKTKVKTKGFFVKTKIKNKSNEKEKQIKKKNQQLLEEHFHEFVKNKSMHPEPQFEFQPTCLTNKPDNLKEPSLRDTLLFKKTNFSRHRQLVGRNEKPKTTQSSKRSSVLNSIVGRKNFQALSNFEWSRLSDSNNFSLI